MYPSDESHIKGTTFKKVDHSEKKREINISYLSKSQLKKKINSQSGSSKVKRNRNGKEVINKTNDYKHIPDAPSKRCFRCGNQNHLALDCKFKVAKKLESKTKVESKQTLRHLYIPPDPCYHYEDKYHSIQTCSEYHSLYYNFYELKPKNRSNNLKSPEKPSGTKSVTRTNDKHVNTSKPVIKITHKKGSKMI